jgi:hypothetical protein|nr:EpsG family protein [uncultured Prevotella sp.]
MGYIITIIFIIVSLLCFLEHRVSNEHKSILYWGLAFILILIAGFREVGIDPDSYNYEYAYLHYDNPRLEDAMEPSYFAIAAFFNMFTKNVHAIFLFYAAIGLILKFIAFKKFSELWFPPVVMYLSFIYELHECVQIRTAIMSGLFMIAILYIAESQRVKATILILIGTVFHMSALILLPLVFLSNKKMSKKELCIWISLIPIGYVLYALGSNLLVNIPIPYIENKLANYQENADVIDVGVNVFSPLQLFTTLLFLYLLYFQDTICTYNKYYPLMMKIFALSLFSYVAFAFLPVFSQRVSYLLRIVTIILFCNIYYTIRPKWVGMAVVILIAFIYLNYNLPYIGYHLLWGG